MSLLILLMTGCGAFNVEIQRYNDEIKLSWASWSLIIAVVCPRWIKDKLGINKNH